MAEGSLTDLQQRFLKISEMLELYEKRESDYNRNVQRIRDHYSQKTSENVNAKAEQLNSALNEELYQLDELFNSAKVFCEDIYTTEQYVCTQVSDPQKYYAIANQNVAQHPVSYSDNAGQTTKYIIDLQSEIRASISTGLPKATLFNAKQVDSFYNDLFTKFVMSRSYYSGLQKYFDAMKRNAQNFARTLVNDQQYAGDARCQEDVDLETEVFQDWKSGFMQQLDSTVSLNMPLPLLNQTKQLALAAKSTSTPLPDDKPHDTIQIGACGLYMGNLRKWQGIYKLFADRYGSFITNEEIRMPAFWTLNGNRNIVFLSPNDRDLDEVESVLCHSVAAFPAGQYKLYSCAADGIIAQSKGMSQFIQEFPGVTGGHTVTQKSEMKDLLDKANTRMDDLLQHQLVSYSDVADFNSKNPLKKIDYYTYYFYHFPGCFDEEMLHSLRRLMKQGPLCGIQVVIQDNLSEESSYLSDRGRNLLEKLRNSVNSYSRESQRWNNMKVRNFAFKVAMRSFADSNYTLLKDYKQKYMLEQNKGLDFTDIIDKSEFQQADSSLGLQIPFGINDDGKVQKLNLGSYMEDGHKVSNEEACFALVIGGTGSGKSTMLHTVITSAVYRYSPKELEIYLLDFKEGMEFGIYGSYRIPHIKYLALDSMQEFGWSILERLQKMIKERADLFAQAEKETGKKVPDLASYRALGFSLPRVMLIIDEFQVLFDESMDKKTASKSAAAFSILIQQGRAVGITCIFATQTLHKLFEGAYSVSKSSLEEMHSRIGLHCSQRESVLLFGESNAKNAMAHQSSKKGSAVYVANDLFTDPVGVRVVRTSESDQRKVLKQIQDRYTGKEYGKTRVFRGNEVPTLSLEKLLKRTVENKKIYLGDSIRIGKKAAIELASGQKMNLAAQGDNVEMLRQICRLSMIQAAALENTRGENIYLLDGDQMIGMPTLLNDVLYGTPHMERIHTAENLFRVIPLIQELYGIFSERREHMKKGAVQDQDRVNYYLIINNMQFIDPVQRLFEKTSVEEYMDDEEELEENNPLDSLQALVDLTTSASSKEKTKVSPIKMFDAILNQGYICGIHTILTCADPSKFKSMMSSVLLPFNYRILTPSSSMEHTSFIDTDISMKYIRDNTVIFSDGKAEPYLIRPFRLKKSD